MTSAVAGLREENDGDGWLGLAGGGSGVGKRWRPLPRHMGPSFYRSLVSWKSVVRTPRTPGDDGNAGAVQLGLARAWGWRGPSCTGELRWAAGPCGEGEERGRELGRGALGPGDG